MAKARASKGLLHTPRTTPNESEERRQKWLADAAANFASPSAANKTYYMVILNALWPSGHGIPGPVLTENDIRAAIDAFRASNGQSAYKDVFRRLRELQGEEGFTSIIKEGTRYQLQSLEVGAKREPRETLGKKDWNALKEKYGHKCANCGAQEPHVKLSPDHKRPRLRGGTNDPGNWQPLCEQCNNIKSNTCRGCTLNCNVCGWAFPDDYKHIVIEDDNKTLIKRLSDRDKVPQSTVANDILRQYFNTHKVGL